MKELLWGALERLEAEVNNEGAVGGISSEIPDVDGLLGGWRDGELIVISGPPGIGKSAFVYQMACSAAVSATKSVALIAMESPKHRSMQRLLCSMAEMDTRKYTLGHLHESDYGPLSIAAGLLQEAPLNLIHAHHLMMDQLRRSVKRLAAEQGIDFLVIDGLNLIRVDGFAPPAANREQEVGIVARDLKALALELDIPILATASMSRAVDQRPSRYPTLSDLRDSGDIENCADVVGFVFRPEYYFGPVDKDGNSLEGKAQLVIAKNRHGPRGTIALRFEDDWGRFYARDQSDLL